MRDSSRLLSVAGYGSGRPARAARANPARRRHDRMPDILVLVAHPQLEHSRVNRALMQAAARRRAVAARRGARPVRAVPRLPDRRRRRAGRAGAGAAGGLAAPDPLVRHAAADEAVAGRGASPSAGPTARAATRCGARTCGWWPPPAGRRSRTGPAATTATSSTPSCRPTSRPPRWPACAGCRRWCCTARTASATSAVGGACAALRAAPAELPRLARDRRARTRARPATCAGDDAPARRKLSMEHGTPWLQTSLIYLAAAVLAVPLARLLGLGSIIGYLAAGIAIGPWGLGLVTDAADHPARGRVRRRADAVPGRAGARAAAPVGAAPADLRLGQRAAVRLGRAADGIAVAFGVDWRLALVAGAGPGDVVHRHRPGRAGRAQPDGHARPGRACSASLLFQDIAAIPILALHPAAGAGGAHAGRRRLARPRPRRWA